MHKIMKIAALFPGQGSQFVGMGNQLLREYSIAKKIFEEASEALGFDIKKLCLASDPSELKKTENAQPALLTNSYAEYQVAKMKWEFEPTVLAGHSLGEFTALVCAGAIDFKTAIRLVRSRGYCINESVKGTDSGMVAVLKADADHIGAICETISKETGKVICLSNINSKDEIVVSGEKVALDHFKKISKEESYTVIPLQVSGAFHSPILKKAHDLFRLELDKINFKPLTLPIISNLTGEYYTSNTDMVDHLAQHLINPVLWYKTMQQMEKDNIDATIEFGGKEVLKKMVLKHTPFIQSYSFNDNLERVLQRNTKGTLKPVQRDLAIKFIESSLTAAISTKNYQKNNLDEYHEMVIVPYRKVQTLKDKIVNNEQDASVQDLQESLNMIISVLKTKMLPKDEQKEYIDNLLEIALPHKEQLEY